MKPESPLSPRDRRLVETIAAHTRPRPMSAARQAAFNRALERRTARRVPVVWPLAYAGAAAAAVALALWLSAPLGVRRPAETAATADAGTALQDLVDADDADLGGALPDDYLMLANVLDVPIEDL